MNQTFDCSMLKIQEEPVSAALAHYAIQFSDYFQGFVFLVHDYFCCQGTVAMEV